MTEPSTNEPPTNETPRERDWFAPPPSQPTEIPDDPSDITYSGPLPQAPAAIPIPGRLRQPQDVRVWPPEREADSTQPFPALRATPLAASPSHGAPPPVGPAAVDTPPAEPPEVPGPAAEPPPAQLPSPGDVPERKPRRTALLWSGAALSVALAVGLPGLFGYNVYKYGRPSDVIQIVDPGKAAGWQHVSWQATLEKISDPTGKPDTSDRQWMKAVVTRTALDSEGAIRHGSPKVRLTDDSGRIWFMEETDNETPPDTIDNKIGTPYRIELLGTVPVSIADEVELLVRPSSYRSVPGQSAEDFTKAAFSSEEKDDHVLRFRR
ncbi:hypothetical protein [Sphaerimonospora thailandensis]|uniref:Uncharacterized protein n=1 Tax=Sphaerimonospora thailandensis TaxID=795644 RepID=A0A8J3RC73_9ACTN|nr:hypothetical protein [Sphaerimonospora thailandensis]GIH73042.1 hypothetical protein Mth01_52950 [Sphaerimonospora thailandensis]